MDDVRTIFKRVGGQQAVADRLGISRSTVAGWSVSNFIPGNRVVQVSRAVELPIERVLELVRPARSRTRRVICVPQVEAVSSLPAKNRPLPEVEANPATAAPRGDNPPRSAVTVQSR
jgi:DNA-binding transcriptional regulator YdaS (Cro superfamily)